MDPVKDKNTVAVETDAEHERLKADARREHDLYLRALADFENYRRRVDRDREKTAAAGKRDILRSLLDVIDGFDRALPYLADAPASVAEGLLANHRKLLNLLTAQDVRPIKAVGEPFDPALHEAIGAAEGDQSPSGTVTDELERGYWLGDEVLRPARVRVAR
jgi:molecular chaperone GrpE